MTKMRTKTDEFFLLFSIFESTCTQGGREFDTLFITVFMGIYHSVLKSVIVQCSIWNENVEANMVVNPMNVSCS